MVSYPRTLSEKKKGQGLNNCTSCTRWLTNSWKLLQQSIPEVPWKGLGEGVSMINTLMSLTSWWPLFLLHPGSTLWPWHDSGWCVDVCISIIQPDKDGWHWGPVPVWSICAQVPALAWRGGVEGRSLSDPRRVQLLWHFATLSLESHQGLGLRLKPVGSSTVLHSLFFLSSHFSGLFVRWSQHE